MKHTPKEAIMYEPSREFLNFHVAGFSHWYGYKVMHKLVPGAKLHFVPEPDNPYDPNAVALYKGKTKIGFVPRACNVELAQLLRFGHTDVFECCVTAVDTTAHPERQVRAKVLVKDARK
jgi:hypothetical protein